MGRGKVLSVLSSLNIKNNSVKLKSEQATKKGEC
jgi:hypothetical protein